MIAGRYSLDREIGRGGTGVVWLGRDEVLHRQVALKRIGLLPGADRTDLARAEREARLGARLNHRHVVAVFDVVTDTGSDSGPDSGSDARWLVMEYVDGLNLDQLARQQGGLTPDAAAPLLRQAADALVAAHAAGIAHRDVKPSNMLVDRHGQVKLTDFGIARFATDTTLTQTGMVTGSPAYLAPEIATGSRGDEASDVWSLGATAFTLLAGRPPYDGGGHLLSTIYRIVNEEPPRLERAGWMAPLLEGTMVRDPSRRWSMAQVRDFLDDPHHRPRGAGGPPSADSARKDAARDAREDETDTQVLGTVGAGVGAGVGSREPAPTPPPARPARPASDRPATPVRPRGQRLLVGLVVVLVLALGAALYAVLAGRDPSPTGTATPSGTPSSATPSPSPSPSPSASPSASAGPTAQGMETFIRDYVAAVAADPDTSWQMLTPKFRRESGGLEKYRSFWGPATNGRVLSITADPDNLTVSYQVRFDNFDNGPGPTVLDLAYDDGRYLIDGERTRGFTPSP